MKPNTLSKRTRTAEWISLAVLALVSICTAKLHYGNFISVFLLLLASIYFLPMRLVLFQQNLSKSFVLTSFVISFALTFRVLSMYVDRNSYWIQIPAALLTLFNLILFISYLRKKNPDYALHLVAWLGLGSLTWIL